MIFSKKLYEAYSASGLHQLFFLFLFVICYLLFSSITQFSHFTYNVKPENSDFDVQFLTDLPCFGEGSAAGISCHGGLQC